MSRTPRIRYRTGDHRTVVTFPCSAMVVERLNVMIPSHDREWSPSQKHWLVVPFYIAELAAVLRAIYGERVVEELPTAPAELVEFADRCLARLHHPDRGGADARMRRPYEAGAVLRERVVS